MYLGRFTLGQTVPLQCTAIDAAWTPDWPATIPTFAAYDGAGTRVDAGQLPPLDLARLTGSFGLRLRLDGAFAVGHYTVLLSWMLGGTLYRAANRFEVVAGGHANGALVSLHHYRRPHADFLVGRLDSEQRFIGRDPEE